MLYLNKQRASSTLRIREIRGKNFLHNAQIPEIQELSGRKDYRRAKRMVKNL